VDDSIDNTLIRSSRCPECGAEMLWTQNAWDVRGTSVAAYRCRNGHALDPASTRQCPFCGLHDTERIDSAQNGDHFRCLRCGQKFAFPR
jgi:hypothetical protein